VAACREAGLPVTALPGASALLPALQLAGLPVTPFLFAGFLPATASERRRAIGALAAVPATLAFYEAPHRLAASLADLAELLGPRPAAVARELTKRFEEVRRGDLAALAKHYAEAAQPKGEIVLVVGPAEAAAEPRVDLDAALGRALAAGSLRNAVAQVAAETGLPRREVYARALALTKASGDA
jgi:16S rRNA (cytidine1402-2'-O)-methyltransferase